MPFDFADAAKHARAQILVPDVPMERIRYGFSVEHKRGRLRTWLLSGAITLAMAGTAAALTTNVFSGVRLWFSGNKTTVAIQSAGMIREPRLADARTVVASATFPVVLPVGIRAGMHVWAIQYAPIDRPNFISIDYRSDRGRRFGFSIFDDSAVGEGNPLIPSGTAHLTFDNAYYRWRVGGENVLVGKKYLSAIEIAQIKAAMAAASPATSLQANRPMFSHAVVLGFAPGIGQVARRYAAADGTSVVIGPNLVRTIPDLASRGKPMIDTRNIHLTHIPSVHGEPDYKNATLEWVRTAVVPPAGVRAIDAVLRSSATPQASFVIITRAGRARYAVWMVPVNSAGAVRKFNVDARTMAVERN